MESLCLLLLPFFSPILLIIICSKNTSREPIKSKELIPQRETNLKLTQSVSNKTTSESYLQPSTSDEVNLKDESLKVNKLFDGECTVAGSMQRTKERTRETQSMTGEEEIKERSTKEKRRNNDDGSRKERRSVKKKNRNDDRSERSVDERATCSEKVRQYISIVPI